MDQSAEQRNCGSLSNKSYLAFLIVFMTLLGGHGQPFAMPMSMQLQLEVFLNGHPTHLVGAFTQLPDRRIAADPSELKEIGIKTTPASGSKHPVPLDSIPGLSYHYDVANQTIAINIPVFGLVPHNYRAKKKPSRSEVQSSLGAVVNYSLFGSAHSDAKINEFVFNGASINLDSHLFSPLGTFDVSGIIGTTRFSDFSALRLDTTWSYSDPETLLTWRAGDAISSGLAWTRPIRMGGLQLQRNFALRPDLITMPLPNISGSAAIPSTVDVFINNVKTFSQDIPPGPFTVRDLPVVSGNGTARVVVRDVTGRETQTETAFYASSHLLRRGLTDFSAEVGFIRLHYGQKSADYESDPVAVGTIRYGMSDTITLQGHAEGGLGLINAGAGAAGQIGSLGVLTLAGSFAHNGDKTGAQIYAAFEVDLGGFTLYASTQREVFGDYFDLAAVSAERHLKHRGLSKFSGHKPAIAIDRISIGIPLPFGGSKLSLSFIHKEFDAEQETDILNASYSHSLTDRLSLFGNGFYDFADDSNFGFYAGVSASLGVWGTGSLALSQNSENTRITADLVKAAKREHGSFGWRLRTSEGERPDRQVSLAYQGKLARVEGTVTQHGNAVSGSAYVDGAIAVAGGGIFFTNRIDDAFAVVDTGAPGVEVLYENRPVGTTGANGKILVSGLRSYERNRISIDPRSLPVTADIPITRLDVTPAYRHGISVNFNIHSQDNAALVVFLTTDGTPLPVGSQGVIVATGDEFIVGYDGQAFVKNLSAQNQVKIDMGEQICIASFAFKLQRNTQVMIEDVICR